MRFTLIACIVLCLMGMDVQAQKVKSSKKSKTKEAMTTLPATTLTVGYLGDYITRPGVMTSISFPIKGTQRTIIKQKRKKEKVKNKYGLMTVSGSLGYYHHEDHHTGLILLPEIGVKRIGNKGFTKQVDFGFGYHHMIWDSPINYIIGEDGSISTQSTLNSGSILTGFNFLLGRDFSVRKKQLPFGYFVKQGVHLQFPYSNGANFKVLTQVGISMKFDKIQKPKFLPTL